MYRTETKYLLMACFAGIFLFLGLLLVGLFVSRVESDRQLAAMKTYHATLRQGESPVGVPDINDTSIRLAMELYGIYIPGKINGPYLDPTMEDRGLTIHNGIGSNPTVYVGRDAFASWALLGSTLAHEIEVHCRQNFFGIHFMNMTGFDGTGAAEREAYQYELAQASRFKLGFYDQELIRNTMNYFYPAREHQLAKQFLPIRMFLDRLSATRFAN